MERFLHRANNLKAILPVLETQMHGLEVDVHSGQELPYLSHDRIIGTRTFGRHGTTKSRFPIMMPRRARNVLFLTDILNVPVPIWFDLKGVWKEDDLARLARTLRQRSNPADIIASFNWDIVDAYRAYDPHMRRFYTIRNDRALEEALARAVRHKTAGIAIRVPRKETHREANRIVQHAKRTGTLVFFWGPRTDADVQLLETIGAAGVAVEHIAQD